MKKIKTVTLTLILILSAFILCACEGNQVGNRVIAGKDVQTFTYAYIRLGDQTIVEGYIAQWRDYTNSDVVQIMINGKYYLTHYSCVVMVADPSHGNIDYSLPSYQDRGT